MTESIVSCRQIETDIGRENNVRYIEVDLTPKSLLDELPESKDRFTITVVEVLPTIEDADAQAGRVGKPSCVFYNAGTHTKEPTPINLTQSIEKDVTTMKKRITMCVFSNGFGLAVERLRHYLIKKDPTQGKKWSEIDVNRCFLDLDDEKKELNPFEELAQNYANFVIERYPADTVYIDCHADPSERVIHPHIILDRTLPPDRSKKEFYQWAKSIFPFTVVWDLMDSAYLSENLDKSFPAWLLRKERKACTLECSAGIGIDGLNSMLTEQKLVEAMASLGAFDLEEEYLDKLRLRIRDRIRNFASIQSLNIPPIPLANALFEEEAQLRREYIYFEIDHPCTFEPADDALIGLTPAGGIIGKIESIQYPPGYELLTVPCECVLLGNPAEEVLGIIPGEKDRVFINIARKEE